jgi:hypothetical protein
MVRWAFILLCFGAPALAESSPELAGPVPLPRTSSGSFCHKSPCSPGCSQDVSCQDYDPRRDSCASPGHILVGWTCSSPCSCASDGHVVCSVSYRCVDMAQEMEDLRRAPKIQIDLAEPDRSTREEEPSSLPSAAESDSGEPMR